MTKSRLLVTLALSFGIFMLAVTVVFGVSNSFLSLQGLVIVVGGTFANAYLSYQREDVLKAFDTIKDLLNKAPSSRERLHKDIMQMIMWSYVVHARDFLGLEKEAAEKVHDPFQRYGMDLVVTGYDSAKIRDMLHTVADAEFERCCAPVTVLRNMAAAAPAFGMVGTLIGMVMIMKNIGMDMSSIGGGLAIAMLSTLYGLLAARLVCLPAADKLLQKEEGERYRNYMLTEGLAMLAEKQSPFFMQDKLNSFLEPAKQFSLNDFEQMSLHRRFAMAA